MDQDRDRAEATMGLVLVSNTLHQFMRYLVQTHYGKDPHALTDLVGPWLEERTLPTYLDEHDLWVAHADGFYHARYQDIMYEYEKVVIDHNAAVLFRTLTGAATSVHEVHCSHLALWEKALQTWYDCRKTCIQEKRTDMDLARTMAPWPRSIEMDTLETKIKE